MKKEVSMLILDGDKFEISEDKEHITGKGKKYTKDEFQKEKKDKFLFIEAPPERIGTGVAYGFSDELKYEKWLKDNNLDKTYEREKKMLEKVRKKLSTLSTEEIEEIKQKQIKDINATTEKYEKFLKKHNLKPDDTEKIEERLEEEYDPFVGGSHSISLYNLAWYRGAANGFGGDWWAGKYYPDLSYFGFDNKASSVRFWISGPCSFAILFAGKNFTGAKLRVWCDLGDLFWLFFGNRASSLIVY